MTGTRLDTSSARHTARLRDFGILPVFGAAIAAIIGLLGLTGWAFGIEPFKRISHQSVSINPLTAVCLILCGAGICLSFCSRRRLAAGLGLLIAAVAATKCVGLVEGGLHIDRILFAGALGRAPDSIPNQMAPNTAIVLLLTGISLAVVQSDRAKARLISQIIAIWILLLGAFVLVGYTFGLMQFGGINHYIPMALPTAIAISFVGIGLLSLSPRTGLLMVLSDDGPVGSICRKMLPLVISIPALAGIVRLWGEKHGVFNEQAGIAIQIMSNAIFTSTLFIMSMVALHRGERALRGREAALKKSEQFNRLIASANPDCISLLDSDGRILFANVALVHAYGLEDVSGLVGQPWGQRLDMEGHADWEMALNAARTMGTGRSTIRHTDRDGAPRWFDTMVSKLTPEDVSPFHFLVMSRDITDKKVIQDQVKWEATHDSLTELPNRTLFQAHLEQQMGTEGQNGFALLILDIDDFKLVNDTLGHEAGDRLLCTIADRVRGAIRAGDFVARLAGDEFAIVLRGVKGEAKAISAAQRIFDSLTEPWIYQGRLADCRVSIGASIATRHGGTTEELLNNADIALYVAKTKGKGQLAVFQPGMRSRILKRSKEISLARETIRQNLIVPHYQAKINLATRGVAGFEALLRWRHASRGIQQPATIAAAFEDLEVAKEITDCMVSNVLRDMRCWLEQGVEFGHVAINVTAADLRQHDFADRLIAQLDAQSIPHRCLQIEITETVFLGRGSECVERALRTLHATGIRIALDDFGTGYASLSHLQQFPVDIVKIDRSFLDRININKHNSAIIETVINLGRSLNLEIVAEGIETFQQEEYLISRGCAYGQGYFYGRAVPGSRVPRILKPHVAPTRKAA